MALTPDDVRNKQFTTVRLREGYDEDEVDAFLDEVEAELTRLLRENDELRAKLAAATRAASAAPATAPQAAVREEPKKAAPPPPQPAAQPPPPPAPPAAVVAEATVGADSAARVLALAQQTADQAIAEARTEANKIVGDARSKAEAIEREARSKADALERDAQDKHRSIIGALENERTGLERKVEQLRQFEREYRSRLKSYLEGQLRQLDSSQEDDGMAAARAGQGAAQSGQNSSQPRPAGASPRQPMRGFLIDEDDS
jgi:DivIVA domain-containing protein